MCLPMFSSARRISSPPSRAGKLDTLGLRKRSGTGHLCQLAFGCHCPGKQSERKEPLLHLQRALPRTQNWQPGEIGASLQFSEVRFWPVADLPVRQRTNVRSPLQLSSTGIANRPRHALAVDSSSAPKPGASDRRRKASMPASNSRLVPSASNCRTRVRIVRGGAQKTKATARVAFVFCVASPRGFEPRLSP